MPLATAIVKSYPDVDATKLAGIAEGAEINPADLAALDSPAATKLAGIEEGADVSPADLESLPDGTTRKAMSDTEKTKLAGVEDEATADQTGPEMRDAVIALADGERQIVITRPVSGEHKIYDVHRVAAGDLEYDYDDTPEP